MRNNHTGQLYFHDYLQFSLLSVGEEYKHQDWDPKYVCIISMEKSMGTKKEHYVNINILFFKVLVIICLLVFMYNCVSVNLSIYACMCLSFREHIWARVSAWRWVQQWMWNAPWKHPQTTPHKVAEQIQLIQRLPNPPGQISRRTVCPAQPLPSPSASSHPHPGVHCAHRRYLPALNTLQLSKPHPKPASQTLWSRLLPVANN